MTNGRFAMKAVALAAAMALGGTAQADIQVAGDFWSSTGQVPSGGNHLLGDTDFHAGHIGPGSLLVDGGSFLQLARLDFGTQPSGVGQGVISGAGSTVELVGPFNRLHVGGWGTGTLSVVNGGLLNTRVNPAPCLVPFHYCDSFVGSAAGGSGVLNIDGAGSEVRTGRWLFVAAPSLEVVDGVPTWGTPGGMTSGTVNVTNGGLLSTDRAQIAPRHWSTHATGSEHNFGEVRVSGAGSRWLVVGGDVVDDATGIVSTGEAGILTANDRNSVASIRVVDGGEIEVQGPGGVYNYILLTRGGGRTDAFVDGAGSRVLFTGPNGVLQVGRSLGSARLDVTNGGVAEGMYYLQVGRDASFGEMLIDGPGSRVSVTQFAELALQGANRSPGVTVGNNSNGVLTVSGGGLLEVTGSGQSAGNSPHLVLGSTTGSAGTLHIAGSGSKVVVSSASVLPGGGPAEALGAYVGIGQQGTGTLNVTQGARLEVRSTVVSTDADRRTTVLNIGGASDTTAGAHGTAVVRGAGSEISIHGDERFVAVGRGPGSFGQLTLAEGGKLSATTVNIGRAGGIGVLQMDAGTIELTGQFAAPVAALTSTGFGVGVGGATGVVRMGNGSTISMSNGGSGGTGMTLGGSTNHPGGDGSLTMSGGSSISVSAAPGLAAFTVGRQGSGLLRMSGHSSIDIGDGRLYVAREAGSDGTVIATGGSVIDAGWVGVGRNRLADGSTVDGGTGTLILNGATLNVAGDVHIGSNGFLGGSAGSINVGGTIHNLGIFSPGSSPGVFTINGQYDAGAGSRLILEVAADGAGGFLTDLVQFGAGVALAGTDVEFRFLGDADPNAFQAAGGFVIDTFVRQADGAGGWAGLAPAAFDDVSFAARADQWTFTSFSFTADGGAVFTAVPVPEPGTWLLLAAGIGALGAWRRRPAGAAIG